MIVQRLGDEDEDVAAELCLELLKLATEVYRQCGRFQSVPVSGLYVKPVHFVAVDLHKEEIAARALWGGKGLFVRERTEGGEGCAQRAIAPG